MDEHLKITFSSSIQKLREVNSSFDIGILKVAYHGDNNNGTNIAKEVFERNIDTIYNCPIVCNYNRDADEIGSHDFEIIQKDGVTKLVNITQPVGVVPESANYWWEECEDITGIHEYLCVEVIIWKRQEAYEKIKDNVITDESMEINIKRGHYKDGIYIIEDFEFTAFCLLESARPCFESASLAVFNGNEFKQQYSEMMEELKEYFKLVNSSKEDDIESKNNPEGGEKQLELKMELLSKFNLSVEALDFDIESMTYEELEEKLNAKYSNGGNDNNGNPDDPSKIEFSLTGEQFKEGLIESLHSEKIETSWGEMCRYMYFDYDSDASEVYCYDTEDWKLYGFGYSMNGDNVVIDFENKKRKKFSIVDFNEGDMEFSSKEMFSIVADASASHKASELTTQFEAIKTELEDKYNAASDTIENMNTELEELRTYKNQIEEEKRKSDEDAVFSMFADLLGVKEFEDLRENCSDFSIEQIEEKCFALRGRKNTMEFSERKQKNTRLPIDKKSYAADEPYGGIFLEFPPNC